VISPKLYNCNKQRGAGVSHHTRVKGYPFEVVLPPEFPIDGVILVDQLRAMDWRGRRDSWSPARRLAWFVRCSAGSSLL
jgi:mRNA interferase MazF